MEMALTLTQAGPMLGRKSTGSPRASMSSMNITKCLPVNRASICRLEEGWFIGFGSLPFVLGLSHFTRSLNGVP